MASDAEFSAAILSRLKAQQDSMERLFKAIEAGIADIADPVRMQGVERLLSALESGIADALEAFGKRDDAALDRIAAAVAAIRLPDVNLTPSFNVPPAPGPTVNVQVKPTPVTVEAVMPPTPAAVVHIVPAPEKAGAVWELRVKGQYGGPDRVMTLTRKA